MSIRCSDGKAAYERAKGKPYLKQQVEFGEKVLYRKGKLDKQNKLEARWAEGVFLGMEWRIGGAIVGDAKGVVAAHAIRRVEGERRWDKDLLMNKYFHLLIIAFFYISIFLSCFLFVKLK